MMNSNVRVRVYSVNKQILDDYLNNPKFKYYVHLEFVNQKALDEAVALGFDVDAWEKRNAPNKVIIKPK